jgi:hypothetical protein
MMARSGQEALYGFSKGMKIQHGATQTEDVTVHFLTNKKFEIHYPL